jgi:hypothetical protein
VKNYKTISRKVNLDFWMEKSSVPFNMKNEQKSKTVGFSGILLFIYAFLPHLTFALPTPTDINDNGILDSSETEVVLNTDFALPAGEYIYNNLSINAGVTLTLSGDPISPLPFKGVKITAQNLTLASTSKITSDREGYLGHQSPGTDIDNFRAGASYGGVGGTLGIPIYGSAIHPTDLGSGSPYTGKGGGAIHLFVSGELKNDGKISSNGDRSSSGGSILVETGVLSGEGDFEANGGGYSSSAVFIGQGGGGRIAIYYGSSSFFGKVEARGGCGSIGLGYPYLCAGDGTAGLFDKTNNNFRSISSWRFEKADSPFNFREINFEGAKVGSQEEVEILANSLNLNSESVLDLERHNTLNVSEITVSNYSQLVLKRYGTTIADNILLSNGSKILTESLNKIELKLKNLSVDATSLISADGMGYGPFDGPGTPGDESNGLAGASYGGVGDANIASSTYGNAEMPEDFGSGGNTSPGGGGGVIKLEVAENFTNDGVVSANGYNSSSGGSVYVIAKNISGNGSFFSKGGSAYCPNFCFRAAGGGRIAVYYENSDFGGELNVLGGGCFLCYGGYGGEGTKVFMQIEPNVATGTSVVFFPGALGSRLYEDVSSEEELWVTRSDSNHARLELNPNGTSKFNIYTKDDTQNEGELDETGIVDDVYSFNMYQSFINDLREWKEEGVLKDYAFIPYDWRLSLDDIISNGTTTAGNLKYTDEQDFQESFILRKLEELSSKSEKIVLIGHSNGGLVVKALVKKLEDEGNPIYNKIDKIIFVAVPQVGTPDAIANLLHGSDIGPYGKIMKNERTRWLSQNMPVAYNLLPSQGYFETVNPGFISGKVVSFEDSQLYLDQINKYGLFVSNPEELESFVLGSDGRTKPDYTDTDNPEVGNTSLFVKAKAMHAVLDNWMPATTTKVIQIAGWGEETLAGIHYKTCDGLFSSEYKCFEPKYVVDGDGTVVTPSALWKSTSTPNVERWWVNLGTFNKTRISILRTAHRDVLEIFKLRDFVKSKIINTLFIDNQNIVTQSMPALVLDDSRLHYTLHSPLTLGVFDLQGRYTGLDPETHEVRQEIPNVTYKMIGNTQFMSVPGDLEGEVKLFGNENGVFGIDIEKQIGNEVTEKTSFQGIPTNASTTVTINISSVASSTLNVDTNGDKVVDLALQAKVGEIVVPPKYIWSGFSQPINDTVFYPNQAKSVFKAGSTVPVKFQLKDSFGTIVKASTTPVWLAPQKGSSMTANIDELVYTNTGTEGNLFKWDPESKQYIYNWSTKGLQAGYWYKISVKLDDGNIYSVIVGLR